MNRPLLALMLLAMLLAACGGGNGDIAAAPTATTAPQGADTGGAATLPTPTPAPTATLSVMPPLQVTSAATATVPAPRESPAAPSPAGTPAQGGPAQEVTIQLTAQNIEFNKDTITVPAGARVVMEFTNRDSAPHNWAAYMSEEAEEEIFVGEVFTGPNRTVTYEFVAPSEPGEYFYRCDVHPTTMVGTLVVE